MIIPESLINSLLTAKGFNKEAFEAVHSSGNQITSIRFNPAKIKHDLTGNFFDGMIEEKIPWSSNAYYLKQRPSFTADPLFHAGAYYVQEASSMFLEEALKQVIDLTQPLKVLDLCAAPGGKSTLIQSLINENSLLVSNEVIKTRVNILTENITKWGSANVIVTNNDPNNFKRLPGFFDVIVVDAPCSGSGLFRKDPHAITEWSEQNVQLCSQRQQRILADILPSLKAGGILIYSTCSYSKEEDETIVDWLIEENNLSAVELKLNSEWGIVEAKSPLNEGYGYRFYPDKVKGEGFFIAAFKNGESLSENNSERINTESKGRRKTEKSPGIDIEILKPYLDSTGHYFYIIQNGDVIAVPILLEKELSMIQSTLYIKKAGIKLGTIIRNELIPDHELALSSILSSTVKRIDVDKESALQYLRRQEVKIEQAEKGWALLTYHQMPLGWIKVLPHRINNYYPKDWRILNK
ncbi:rRNA cytosine-C5-methyltransferase [soil metagenome]